jgi:ketosteroid isomerase-like protein
MSLVDDVREFWRLLASGETVEAMERFYAEDVCVFENRSLARAGRQACIAYEREQLQAGSEAPRFKLHKRAIDEAAGHVFIEYTVRFLELVGKAARIEQVAVQTWERGKIVQERFYYDGVVVEG